MSLIRKREELCAPQFIKAMIYGSPGVGKTTLALSAPKPLLLDFDNGIHRANFGHQTDTYPAVSWNEALQVLQENLSAYDTIIVDTIGKMLDYITDYVDKQRITGFKRWSAINDEFTKFTRTLHLMNKNIIFVAHRDSRKEGDETVFIPALREKNYTAIVTELDLLGYVEMKGVNRSITFNPTARNDGKNTCNLAEFMTVPVVVDNAGGALKNDFFTTQIIKPYTENLAKRKQVGQDFEKTMTEVKEFIALVTDERGCNDFILKLDEFNHVGNSREKAKQLIHAKATELGLTLNRKEKRYERAA